jgi:hypothetical protein
MRVGDSDASGWRRGNGRSYVEKKGRKVKLDEGKLMSGRKGDLGSRWWQRNVGELGRKKETHRERGVREYI